MRKATYLRFMFAVFFAALVIFSGHARADSSPLDLLDTAFVVKGKADQRFDLPDTFPGKASTPLGPGEAMEYHFKTQETSIQVKLIRFPNQPFAVLGFSLPEGMKDAATGDYNLPALAFALKPRQEYPRVFTFEMKAFAPPTHELIPTAGPVILYNDDLDTIIISPLDNFCVGLTSPKGGELLAGIEGEVLEFPEGFTHKVLVYAGKGINASMEEWSSCLRKWHGKERIDPYKDKPLSYLGYWTDNGSYYYYKTEKGMNYEDTMIAVKEDADRLGIPYGYFQLDSWWYEKVMNFWLTGGALVWEPKPEVFPNGVDYLHEAIGLPFVAHNRWYVKKTPHKAEYNFIDGEGWRKPSIPTEQRFWDMIMDNCVKWGVEVYEQDWLVTMYWGVPYLRNGVDHAETWLGQMTGAARDRGLTMQFCMAPPGFFLQNVKLGPIATHTRCSGDYVAGAPKTYYWPKFFKTSMLAWAVGFYPFKDCFMTMPGQRTLRSEKCGVQETLISNLSAGPVGPGDKIGFADKELLMRTCRTDGLLLKPDKPAMPIDEMFLDTKKPFIVTTSSEHSGKRWHYVAGFNIYPAQYKDKSISLSQLDIEDEAVIWDWREQRILDSANRVNFPDKMKKNDYAYYIVAPVLANGMAVIGETEKFITASKKRFSEISADKNSLVIKISGVPGERIKILVYSSGDPESITNKQEEKIKFDYRNSLVSIEIILDSTGADELIVL